MVRPLLSGISRLAQAVGTEPLDKEEVDSGSVAWSALMYEQGAQLSGSVLVTLWSAGVLIPRLVEYAERRAEKQKAANEALLQSGRVPVTVAEKAA